ARGLSSRFRRAAKDRLRQNGACRHRAAGARRHAGKSRSKAPLAVITVECQRFYLRRPGPSDKIELLLQPLEPNAGMVLKEAADDPGECSAVPVARRCTARGPT